MKRRLACYPTPERTVVTITIAADVISVIAKLDEPAPVSRDVCER